MDEVGIGILRTLQGALEHLHQRCTDRLLTTAEVQAALKTNDRDLADALTPGSDLFRIWDRTRKENTDWWREGLSHYVDRTDCENILWRLRVVQKLIQRSLPEVTDPAHGDVTEYYLQGGDVFRARQIIHRLMLRATKSLVVVDQYLDAIGLDLIDSMEDHIDIKLLTGKPKAFFVSQLELLKQRRPRIEARSSTTSHDRWLLIDDREVWHLGASLNGLGKSTSRISRIILPEKSSAILADVAQWWSAGSQV